MNPRDTKSASSGVPPSSRPQIARQANAAIAAMATFTAALRHDGVLISATAPMSGASNTASSRTVTAMATSTPAAA
jgi:hypothetical protein